MNPGLDALPLGLDFSQLFRPLGAHLKQGPYRLSTLFQDSEAGVQQHPLSPLGIAAHSRLGCVVKEGDGQELSCHVPRPVGSESNSLEYRGRSRTGLCIRSAHHVTYV